MKSHNYLKFLKQFALKKSLSILYLLIIIIIVVNATISLVRPKIQGIIIDRLSISNSVEDLNYYIILFAFLGMLLISYSISYIQKYVSTIISEKISANVRSKIHEKLYRCRVELFRNMDMNEILVKFEKDVMAIKQCGITSVITLISNIVIIIAVPPYMFMINKKITIINVVLIAIAPLLTKIMAAKIQKTSKESLEKYSCLISTLRETYDNWVVIRTFQCIDYVKKKFADRNQAYRAINNKQALLQIINTWMILFIQFIGIAVIWVIGSKEVFEGTMTIGTITALMNYQAIIMNPIIGIGSFANDYNTAIISLKDLSILLDYEESGGCIEQKFKGEIDRIKLKDITFNYDNQAGDILKDINYTFEKGVIYAIQGESGKGKSTLLSIIAGMITPTKGEIFVNNQVIDSNVLMDYWKNIGYVTQHSTFFNDTISCNLKLKNSNSIDTIESVSKILGIYDDIIKLENTWDTSLETEPYNFSEGQLRRFDIIRNIVKKPHILIFDEVTANIDTKRREEFYRLLHMISKDKIIIFSTHNVSELSEADEILKL